MKNKKTKNDIVIYQASSGAVEVRVDKNQETIQLTQQQVGQLFDVQKAAISKHIKNIFETGELNKNSTVSILETVQIEGGRKIKRKIEHYNLDLVLSIGYRVNSVNATKFRQWATKTLRQHITKGYTINPRVVKNNYAEFQKALENIKYLLPADARIDTASVVELISAFADTWVSLTAYDEDTLVTKGETKRSVTITAKELGEALLAFKRELARKGGASELFGVERQAGIVSGIVGNVMQSFGAKPLYATVEEKAAHLLYFMVKNHPFADGNKRSGAYAFVWFLKKSGALNRAKMTTATLTALTLLVAQSDPKDKERMVRLVLQLLKK